MDFKYKDSFLLHLNNQTDEGLCYCLNVIIRKEIKTNNEDIIKAEKYRNALVNLWNINKTLDTNILLKNTILNFLYKFKNI